MTTVAVRVATVGACVWSGLVAAQTPQVFTSNTTVVRVHVSVVADGRPVDGLGAEHFALRDNGVLQRVEVVAAPQALDVALLVDRSASTSGSSGAIVRQAAVDVLQLLREDDRAAVYAFAESPVLIQPLRTVRDELVSAVKGISGLPTAKTALWDAVVATSAAHAGSTGVPHMMAFTDGCDNSSWVTPQQVGEWLGRLDVSFDLVWTGSSPSERGGLDLWADVCHGPIRLEQATSRNGGHIFRTADRNVADRIDARLTALRSGYLLTYTPTGVKQGDGWHRIDVRLQNGARGRVTARPGYFSGGGPR